MLQTSLKSIDYV